MSPFNDEEEIDGDELNLEPERVNALRDPGYQLEKSRKLISIHSREPRRAEWLHRMDWMGGTLGRAEGYLTS